MISLSLVNIRDFAEPPHFQVDDAPYGGGAGMVMKADPLAKAMQAVSASRPGARRILLSPRGKVFSQTDARRISSLSDVIYVCGRYEGVDERFIENYIDEELSIGDYILMGGEVAAMVVIEASTRLIDGVLGNAESITSESFATSADLLEAPHYTRPAEFEGKEVPPVLVSGNHKSIEKWRFDMSVKITKERRAELLKKITISLMSKPFDLSVVLLHDQMVDKQGVLVTTSLTLIDVHDIARSSTTYGVVNAYIAHPSPNLRRLARTIKDHWEEGRGATYNANRKEAIENIKVVSDLDEAIADIDERTGKLPKLIATSAHKGEGRISYQDMSRIMAESSDSFLLMFGTGWGMSDQLLGRADYLLEPIEGPTPYNHLSVRSACAIILDRLHR